MAAATWIEGAGETTAMRSPQSRHRLAAVYSIVQQAYNPAMTIHFSKMHGLGNDFVVIDGRGSDPGLSSDQIGRIADRRRGVGFDQLLILEPARSDGSSVYMRILNPDGGEARACGNGTRCVADLIMTETGRDQTVVDTIAGPIACHRNDDATVTCDMGMARLNWADIPLSKDVDTLCLPVSVGDIAKPVAVGMGNPHAVFFVDDAEAIDLSRLGPLIENHSLFPDRTNVEFAHIAAPDLIRMRVWERGVGVTSACGSGACAAAVAAARRGLTGRSVTVRLDGGDLAIDWQANGHVLMTGSVSRVFSGVFDATFLAPGSSAPDTPGSA